MFPIGEQRVGIVTNVPALDEDDQPRRTEYGEPIYEDDPLVEWVDECLFEVQTPSELQGSTVTTSEMAIALLPLVDGGVPLADGGVKPVAEITSSLRLRDADTGLDYVMRGDAVLERGPVPHVFCSCERQQG